MIDAVAPWRVSQNNTTQKLKTAGYIWLGTISTIAGVLLCSRSSTPLKGIGYGLVTLGIVCDGGAGLSWLAPRIFKKEPQNQPVVSSSADGSQVEITHGLRAAEEPSSASSDASGSSSLIENTFRTTSFDRSRDLKLSKDICEFKDTKEMVADFIQGIKNNPRYKENPLGFIQFWEANRAQQADNNLEPEDSALAHFQAKLKKGFRFDIKRNGAVSRDQVFAAMRAAQSASPSEVDPYVRSIEANADYQRAPIAFIERWKEIRGHTEEFWIPQDGALAYFKNKHGL